MNTIRNIFGTRRPTSVKVARNAAARAYFKQFATTVTDEQLDRVAHRYARPIKACGSSLDLQWGYVLAKLAHDAGCEVAARFIPMGGVANAN